uniref:GDNF/GAS1 domain-containing protein n=1 Tax=Romanomermis culicivorax TaxID=13658 RepID=A0A915HXV7_ROMCU
EPVAETYDAKPVGHNRGHIKYNSGPQTSSTGDSRNTAQRPLSVEGSTNTCPTQEQCFCSREMQDCDSIFEHRIRKQDFKLNHLQRICLHPRCRNNVCPLERDCLQIYVDCADKPNVKVCPGNMVMSAVMHQCSPQNHCTNKTTDIQLRKLGIHCEENDPDLAYLNKKKGR